MKIATARSTNPDARSAIDAAFHELTERLGALPDLLILSCTPDYAVEEVLSRLRELAPDLPVHGATSAHAVMTETGFHSEEDRALGLFGILDPGGSYGVGLARIGEDPKEAVRTALRKALLQARCPGEVPAIVWMSTAPGREERVLQGIEEFMGPNVPIAGGTSADNSISGKWKQFSNTEIQSDAVILSVLFPSQEILFAFKSGYEPTEKKGRVTKAEGRVLQEIDGRPAVEVYREWFEEDIPDWEEGADIQGVTDLHPLGRTVGILGGVPYFRLSYPVRVAEKGCLFMFSTMEEGDEICFMQGTRENMVRRGEFVAQSVLRLHKKTPEEIAGALVIYCAGYLNGVRGRMPEVAANLRLAFGGKPFLGTFTFGEQGCFLDGENRHGNLMISVLIFCKETGKRT